MSSNNININKTNNQKCIIQNITSINVNNYSVNSIKTFPSGNIISVSNDKSIKIFDGKIFTIIQNIKNAHNNWIFNVEIIDEKNFITCCSSNIKIWKKKENEYELNIIIKNAHKHFINKVIYCSNENLISCSSDKTIKIWEEKNYKYQNINTLKHSESVISIILLDDKNILVSVGKDGIKFWNIEKIKNIKLINSFENVDCIYWNGLERINDNQIIIGSDESIKIIMFTEEKYINEIYVPFNVWCVKSVLHKNIIFVAGESNDIFIYRIDNFEKIKIIKNAHTKWIKGFNLINDNLIASYSFDNVIKIWSI